MSDLNVIEVTPRHRVHSAVQMTRYNAQAIHDDERFFTAWVDNHLLRVVTLSGSEYLRPGYWVVALSPYNDCKVFSDEAFRREFAGIPEDYDPDQRVLF